MCACFEIIEIDQMVMDGKSPDVILIDWNPECVTIIGQMDDLRTYRLVGLFNIYGDGRIF